MLQDFTVAFLTVNSERQILKHLARYFDLRRPPIGLVGRDPESFHVYELINGVPVSGGVLERCLGVGSKLNFVVNENSSVGPADISTGVMEAACK